MIVAGFHCRYSMIVRASVIGAALLILSLYAPSARAQHSAAAERQVSVFFSPFSDLARIDGEVMSQARRSIDVASDVMPAPTVLQAMAGAAVRNVRIRIYLPEPALTNARLAPEHPLIRLSAMSNVEIRLKPATGPDLHWRATIIDSRLVRIGGASLGDAKQTDADLLLLTVPDIVRAYEAAFTVLWDRGTNRPFTGR
jgi:phosphatidylserine/phosphatidylglycerophosphate/cardiolipin synthase-like enzyme